MGAPYKPRESGSLKQAVAELVAACGGQVAVAPLLGCKPQHVARMTDDAHPKTQMRIDQVLILEKVCGHRIVTEWMASEQGCIVEQMGAICGQSLPIMLGRITSQMGELLSAAAKDVQAGVLTPTNAGTVIDETDDVVCAVLTLRMEARAVRRKAAA